MTFVKVTADLSGDVTDIGIPTKEFIQSSPINATSSLFTDQPYISSIQRSAEDSAVCSYPFLNTESNTESSNELDRLDNEADKMDPKAELGAISLYDSQGESTGSTSPPIPKLTKGVLKKPLRVTRQTGIKTSENSRSTKSSYHTRLLDPASTPLRPRQVAPSGKSSDANFAASLPPQILNVRVNRAFEMRYTECQEQQALRSARQVSYRMYLLQASVMKRVPRIELGAGYP